MKPIDLFSALDCVSEEYLYEASAYRQEQGSHKVVRLLLIAAILVTLATTAYAVAIRNMNWPPEEQEVLETYNEKTNIGAASKAWSIENVDIELSIVLPKDNQLEIHSETRSKDAEGTVNVGKEYWLEKWNGETYEEMRTKDGKPWLLPEEKLECNGEHSWIVDYSASYGQLEPGNYRVGMTISLVDSNGTQSEKGCYAKFQIFTEEIGTYVEEYAEAYTRLVNEESFHIRVKNRNKEFYIPDSYRIGENWKSGQDYFSLTTVYSNADDSVLLRTGELTRDGMGFHLAWEKNDAAANPSSVQNAEYVNGYDPIFMLPFFEQFFYGVEGVTKDGQRVVLIKPTNSVLAKREVTVEYDASGNICKMSYADYYWDYYIDVEVIPEDADRCKAWIASIDVETPQTFAYTREMEALDALDYRQERSAFKTATPIQNPNREAILQRAKQVCGGGDYDMYSVSFDSQTNMWKVEFVSSHDDYIYRVLYLDANGVPLLQADRPYPEYGETLLPKPSEWEN